MSLGQTITGYLNLCRISNLPSIWTNVLCAAILATGKFPPRDYLIAALSLSCFYLGGMCLNDFCDRGHDSIHRPSRPIPSGVVSSKGALVMILALFALALALLLSTDHPESLFAAVILMAAIIVYDLRHKQHPCSVLLMACCRFLVFMVTALALTGRTPGPVIVAGAIHGTYVIVLSMVARYENNRDRPFPLPVIPGMLAGISLLDGLILAVYVEPAMAVAGIGGAGIILAGQRYVRGD